MEEFCFKNDGSHFLLVFRKMYSCSTWLFHSFYMEWRHNQLRKVKNQKQLELTSSYALPPTCTKQQQFTTAQKMQCLSPILASSTDQDIGQWATGNMVTSFFLFF